MYQRTNSSLSIYFLLALFAFFVYFPGSWWGAPHATAPERTQSWGVDDEMPLGPLSEIHNIIAPKADRKLGYPLMHSFVVAGVYTPYLGYLWLTGNWEEISGVYPFGMKDPVSSLKIMTYIAHLVTVLMAVVIVLATFEAGRVLKNQHTGIFAALFAMTSYPMFYYARSGNVDVPMLFFVALTIMVFAHCKAFGFTARRAAWLGVFAGFALGTKEQAIGVLLAIPFFVLAISWGEQERRWTTWSFWRAPVTGLFSAILAFGFGSGLFIEPSRYIAHLEVTLHQMEKISQGDVYVPYVFPFGWEGNIGYVLRVLEILTEMMTLPGLLLGIGGLILLLTRWSKASSFAVLTLVYLTFIFFTLRTPQIRYIIPAAYLLAFTAAWLVTSAWEHKKVLVRKGTVLIAIGIISFNLLRGAGLTYEMIDDSRYAAAEWLAARTSPGDTIEYFGPAQKLPPLKSGVTTRAATYYGGVYVPTRKDDAKVREIVQGWEDRRPTYIILIPDLTSPRGIAYNNSCPPQLCESLLNGSKEFPLVARFETDPLFNWLKLPDLDYPTINPPIHIFSMSEPSDP